MACDIETVERKRLLYKTKVDYQIGEDGEPINDYALNHALGCSHGCRYPCYAQGTAVKSGNVESYEDWCRPKLVANAMELLERELRSRQDVKRIHMCFTTDPFPYLGELAYDDVRYAANCEIGSMTMKMIEKINAASIPVTILTKGVLPLPAGGEHIEYMGTTIPRFEGNYYGISLVSLNEGFRAEYEPGTAPYAKRIESLAGLHNAGEKTWVSMEPFPALSHDGMVKRFGWGYCSVPEPFCADIVEKAKSTAFDELAEILARISFVDRIVFGRWNYNPDMPVDTFDEVSWYADAAKLVQDFCQERGIECIVKKGTE